MSETRGGIPDGARWTDPVGDVLFETGQSVLLDSAQSSLAEVVDRFTAAIRELGPLGEPEGIERGELRAALQAVRRLVPYLRLVEREKLRVPVKSEEAYNEFFASAEVWLDRAVISRGTRTQTFASFSPSTPGKCTSIANIAPSLDGDTFRPPGRIEKFTWV